jgi:hypothetical protein
MYKLVQIVAHKEGKKLGELTRDSLRRYIEVSTGKSYSSLVKKLEKMEESKAIPKRIPSR